MKSKKVFWGIFLVLAGIMVLASQLGSFANFGFWTVLASIALVALLAQSIFSVNFFGITISLALLYIIYTGPLNLFHVPAWALLLAALLAGIGLSMLFRKKPKVVYPPPYQPQATHQQPERVENNDDNCPYASVRFGSASKYLHSTALYGGQFSASFGSLEIFFDQAILAQNGAEIFVDCSFGTIKLYVPRSWYVTDSVNNTLGGVNNDSDSNAPEGIPQLNITGNVQFGTVEVLYV